MQIELTEADSDDEDYVYRPWLSVSSGGDRRLLEEKPKFRATAYTDFAAALGGTPAKALESLLAGTAGRLPWSPIRELKFIRPRSAIREQLRQLARAVLCPVASNTNAFTRAHPL